MASETEIKWEKLLADAMEYYRFPKEETADWLAKPQHQERKKARDHW
jgi:hypothetical protein